MVDSVPGLPGEVDDLPCYRGDPFSQTFQFVDQDTTAWDANAQLRRYPDSDDIIVTFTVAVAYQSDVELVNLSLSGEDTALLPSGLVPWDFEVLGDRTYLKGNLDVDPDVTRVEGS